MARMPDPWKSLASAVAAIREDVKRLQNRSPFFGSGMHTNGAGGLDSDNYVTGASGFSLAGASGNAEFNSLTLRGGIIGNAALTSPVSPGSISNSTNSFALTIAFATVNSVTITVPDGYSAAVVNVVARVAAYDANTSGGIDGLGGDYLYARVTVAGIVGTYVPSVATGNGGYATNVAPITVNLAGLTPASTFTVTLDACTGYLNWAANGSNLAQLSGSILWFR